MEHLGNTANHMIKFLATGKGAGKEVGNFHPKSADNRVSGQTEAQGKLTGSGALRAVEPGVESGHSDGHRIQIQTNHFFYMSKEEQKQGNPAGACADLDNFSPSKLLFAFEQTLGKGTPPELR